VKTSPFYARTYNIHQYFFCVFILPQILQCLVRMSPGFMHRRQFVRGCTSMSAKCYTKWTASRNINSELHLLPRAAPC